MKYKNTVACMALIIFLTACGEPTSTQRGYIDARDKCRELSELRVSPDMRKQGNSEYKKALLIGFSDCMGKSGWAVTAPNKDKKPTPPANKFGEAPVPVEVQPLQAPPQMAENPDARRAAECAYARQAINHSSNARAIAKACETECANQRRLAPDMPKPPACRP